MGSSLVMITNKGLMIMGYPFLGFIGFTISLFVALISVYNFFIKKERK
jgi:hypothetical protein